MTSTLAEGVAEAVRKVRVLTYVLNYDDLLADDAASFRIDHAALPLTIGRASDGRAAGLRTPSELRVPDRWASSPHCAVARLGTTDVLHDHGSRNGTWVNGERVERYRPLVDGDLIEAGHSLFCYRVVDEPLAELLAEVRGVKLGPTTSLCPEVATLLRDLQRVALSRESVLILGETGTGKESAAETVHRLSGRGGRYCTVDCGAVPESLFESTFFGHRKGAFTGAVEARVGEVARADGGTLFLDEVTNMGPASQAKLLRVIEEGRVTPLGAAGSQEVDVRWVAATNRDLFAEVVPFRSDLLRRLTSYVARLPPLRRRREDLGTLAAWLLRAADVSRASITAAAGRQLFSSRLSGNIRQLRTVLRTAAMLADGAPIGVGHLPPLDLPGDVAAPRAQDDRMGAARSARTPDVQELEAALNATHGNIVQAAQSLGTHPRQLYRWIERHAISLERFRK